MMLLELRPEYTPPSSKVWRELQQVPAINRSAAEHQMFQDPQQRLTPKQRLSYHK